MKAWFVVIAAPLALIACRGRVAGLATAEAPPAAAAPSELNYIAAPSVTAVDRLPGGRIRLVGRAAPGARVRLASPSGEAAYAVAGPDGDWRLSLPPEAGTRLFGLSMQTAGRTIQSEGYLALTSDAAAQLRSGDGAEVIAARRGDLAILAIDFDSKGGAVVSGRAAPGGVLELWADGVRGGEGAAGPDGRFSIALNEPLSFAEHRLAAVEGARRVEAATRLSTAAPLVGVPFRAGRTEAGWRIDWITPGGGLQSTLLVAPPTAAVERGGPGGAGLVRAGAA